jgi:hypothetical protein
MSARMEHRQGKFDSRSRGASAYLWRITQLSGRTRLNRRVNVRYVLALFRHGLIPAASLVLAQLGYCCFRDFHNACK